MSWTVDSRCSQCGHKEDPCADRAVIVPALVSLSNELNTNPVHVDSPGDGILIMSCADFIPK